MKMDSGKIYKGQQSARACFLFERSSSAIIRSIQSGEIVVVLYSDEHDATVLTHDGIIGEVISSNFDKFSPV